MLHGGFGRLKSAKREPFGVTIMSTCNRAAARCGTGSLLFFALSLLLMASVAAAGAPGGAAASEIAGEAIGSGDGRIHVIPSIAPYSLKNGETLTVTAIVRSERPVASVTADLAGLATITLQPNQRLGGVSAEGTTGIWTAEWVAAGLEEKVYAATLTVTDVDGHLWTDHSLAFSDPAAGHSTPGTTAYPSGEMRRVGAEIFLPEEARLACAVIDAANGYAYFGTTEGTPGRVVKVALGSGDSPPTRVGAVTLATGETWLTCAVIDAANGYGYFGVSGYPSVVKVALGSGDDPPTRVGAVTLDRDDFHLTSAVIDPPNGYAYFATCGFRSYDPGRVVKVALGSGSNLPTRVGAVTLEAGEVLLGCAVIDAANGYAYFGGSRVFEVPSSVVKVALGRGSNPPMRIGAVNLDAGAEVVTSGGIDPVNGYAYFATGGRVVKVAVGSGDNPPTLVGSFSFDHNDDGEASSMVIDPVEGYAYFGTGSWPGRVVKVALGRGDSPPVRAGTTHFATDEYYPICAVIDAANGYAYFGTDTSPGRVVKVALGSDNPPAAVGGALFEASDKNPISALIDAANGYAYFGCQGYPDPSRVVKVALGNGNNPPQRIGATVLAPDDVWLACPVIDTANGYAYFVTRPRFDYTSPDRVVKMALGSGNNPPARIGVLTLDAGEYYISSAVIDSANGYAYYSTGARVVKVALGNGSNPPTRVGATTLADGEDTLTCAVIDTTKGYAYFGTSHYNPGQVVKVSLGAGSNLPTRVGAVTLDPGEDSLTCAVIDTANGYAYFGTDTNPGRVVKVALGIGDNPPTRIGAVTLDPGEDYLTCAVIDVPNGYAYFSTEELESDNPDRIVKVALGGGSNPPTRVGALSPVGKDYITSAVIDADNGYAYLGTIAWTHDIGAAIKVALSLKNAVWATRFTLPDPGDVTDVRFYSHAPLGNVRLALYDNAEPKNLLWESGVVSNNADEADLIVPVGVGTPASLHLSAGTYWAAWQVDSAANVPSYTPGVQGEGFSFAQEFGPAPATLARENIVPTSDRWTMYMVYVRVTPTGLVLR